MTEADLARIEAELGVRLPDAYRETMLRYPVPAFAGCTDTDLWDDADALIRFNRELRQGAPGGVAPWPPHMFALGHGGDGCPAALDLREPGAPAWWVEHGHLGNPASGRTHASFAAWLEEHVAGVRSDAEGDGIDPGGTPAARRGIEATNARGSCLALLVLAAIVAACVAGIFALAGLFR